MLIKILDHSSVPPRGNAMKMTFQARDVLLLQIGGKVYCKFLLLNIPIYNQKAYKTLWVHQLLNALTTMSFWFIETDFFTSVCHLPVHILFLFLEAKARHQCLSTPWW